MSSDSCLSLVPSKPCGSKGSCETSPSDNSTSICICADGWSRSLEFSYFVEEETLNICNYNEKIIELLWLLVAISSAVAITIYSSTLWKLYSAQILKKKNLKRALPSFAFQFCVITFSVYRSINAGALFGHDVFFSFFIAQALLLLNVISLRAQTRYMYNFVRRDEWTSTNVERLVASFVKMQPMLLLIELVAAQIFWASALVERKETALWMVRCSFLMTFSLHVTTLLFSLQFLKQYRRDLDTVARFKGNIPPSESIESSKELSDWVKQHIKKSRDYRYVAFVTFLFGLSIHGLPAVWNFYLIFCTLILPVLSLCLNMIFLYSYVYNYQLAIKKVRSKITYGHSVAARNAFPKHLQAGGAIIRKKDENLDDTDSRDSEDELV